MKSLDIESKSNSFKFNLKKTRFKLYAKISGAQWIWSSHHGQWVNLSDCLCQQLKPHDDFHLYFQCSDSSVAIAQCSLTLQNNSTKYCSYICFFSSFTLRSAENQFKLSNGKNNSICTNTAFINNMHPFWQHDSYFSVCSDLKSTV